MNYLNENVTICDHPLIKHKLSILRNVNTGTSEFRLVMQELSLLIGYEAMKNLKSKRMKK